MVTSPDSGVPRLVIAAPSSGSGKTTVATGLMAALAGRGLAVSPHKVGPDYIDPGYHALATGRVGRNLDAYLCGPELVGPLFLHGARGCDIAVVEGVMGLYDGAAGEGELASTAQVAKLLRAPVVLVVDASSQSRSVAALVHGFVSWDPEVRIGGVILNKVASDRHEVLLREAVDSVGVPVLGVLRRAAPVETPARHLGLVPVAERRAQAVEAVAAMAAQMADGCDLEALVGLARSAGALPCAAWDADDALDFSPPPPLPVPTPGAAAPGSPLSALNGPRPQTPDGLSWSACPAFSMSAVSASGRTRMCRRPSAASTAAPRSSSAPAIAAPCMPSVNASRAAVARASPARPGSSAATDSAPPRVSLAGPGASEGTPWR